MKNATTQSKALVKLFASPKFKEAGVTARVHLIANAMRNKSRAEVVAVAVAKKINPLTARTQYQAWFSQHRAI